MVTPTSIFLCLALTVLASSMARADSGDEATITVVDEGATPDDVVKVIELPDRSPSNASKATGADTTNNAKEKSADSGREFGRQVSEEARSQDLKDLARDEAKQQGKNNSHNDDPGGNRQGPPH
jgi:hypothetical protein